MDRYLKKELKILQDKVFKALNIFEEENGIKPKGKKKREYKVRVAHDSRGNITSTTSESYYEIARLIKNPLPFSEYIDRIVKNIEGLVFGLNTEEDIEYKSKYEKVIQDLLSIKYNLLSMRFIKDVEYYEILRQKLFKDLDIIRELINYVENN